jgi:TRAP-type C4-dicarboxylate transport system substrate-binding protein
MRIAFVALVVLLFAATPALAQEVPTLRFANTSPQTSPTWKMQWEPWVQQVEKDADGALKIQVYFGGTLATMQNVYDRLINGVADLGYGIFATIRGKFPSTGVVELPLDVNGRHGSMALWALYANGTIAPEYSDVRPLGMNVYPQTGLHFNRPVAKLEDIKGMKIGANGRQAAEAVDRLGAAPVTMDPGQLYESLQRNLVNGVTMAWTGVLQFKVAEVTTHHLDYALGSSGGFMFMNKDAYAKLTGKAKAAIDKNSGLVLSRGFGEVLDRIAVEQADTVKKMQGHSIYQLAPAERARWDKLLEPLVDAWIKETPNGAAIWAAYKAEVQKAKASN